MVAKNNTDKRIATFHGVSHQAYLWLVLCAIGLAAGAGIFVAARQSAALRNDFRQFSDHVMETAFHLHRMSMQVAELAAEDLAGYTDEERTAILSSNRITITAQYANVAAGRLEYFTTILGEDRPEVVAMLRTRMEDFSQSVPALLARLRAIDELPSAAERAEAVGTLRPLIATVLRDAKGLNDIIRNAEARTFSMFRTALSRSGTSSTLTIFFFALISASSLVILKMTSSAAKAREEALRAAKETAERLLEREREFLRNTSHELRTPVSGLLGMAQILADEPLSANAATFSRNILSAAEDLSNLVGTVLDSEVEVDGHQDNADWFVLASALEDVLSRYEAKAREKGLAFSFQDGTAGQEAFFPVAPVRTIVSAVLSNAVKFTDAGSVTLEGRAGEERVTVRIRDTGIGMDEETSARATERFFQAESSYTKRHRGLGLGLWTAKRMVDALGGELRVSSSVGAGTEVDIVLPARLRAASVAAQPQIPAKTPEPVALPSPKARGTETKRPTILVAEDDAINRMGLEYLLKRAGYAVLSASDGQVAMEAARGGDYQLAILDLSMPFHTGLEVLQCVRDRKEQGGGLRIPAFALTGHSTVEDRRSCMEAGFDDFITKPYNAAYLVTMIGKALESRTP